MSAEYNKKTVAELQEILRGRNISHNGKKADLVARLAKDDEDKAKADPAAPSTTATTNNPAKAENAEDVIDWDDDAGEDTAAAKPTSEAGANALAAGGQGAVSNPVAVPNQEIGENPATTDDLKVTAEGAKPSEKAEKPESETANNADAPAEEGGKQEANFAKGLPASEMEEELKKRKARAEKFGIVEDSQPGLSEAEKQLQRAKRFGASAEGDSVGFRRLDEALPEGPLRKRGRNDNHQGGRGGKRRNFGGGRNGNNRNRRRGNDNNKNSGQSSLSEKDLSAMEARKKRFATAA